MCTQCIPTDYSRPKVTMSLNLNARATKGLDVKIYSILEVNAKKNGTEIVAAHGMSHARQYTILSCVGQFII